jgi:hypothetical protein
MRKIAQFGKYIRSFAIPPWTSFTVYTIGILEITNLNNWTQKEITSLIWPRKNQPQSVDLERAKRNQLT